DRPLYPDVFGDQARLEKGVRNLLLLLYDGFIHRDESVFRERVMAFSTVFTSIPICLERSRAVSSGCSLNQSVVCFNSSRNARMMSSCSSTQVREARMNSRLVV